MGILTRLRVVFYVIILVFVTVRGRISTRMPSLIGKVAARPEGWWGLRVEKTFRSSTLQSKSGSEAPDFASSPIRGAFAGGALPLPYDCVG